jgi:hypothetical protein
VIRPVYNINNNWDEFISATNGGLVIRDFNIFPTERSTGMAMGGGMYEDGDWGYNDMYYEDDMYYLEAEIAVQDAPAARLSSAEEDLLASLEGVISAERAVEIMIASFNPGINPDDFRVHKNIHQHWINADQYIWGIHLERNTDTDYESYSISVDAMDGTVIGYSSYSWPIYWWRQPPTQEEIPQSDMLYTYDQAKEIATAKILELLPANIDFYNNFELRVYNARGGGPIVPLAESFGKEQTYHFEFVRIENGLPFPGNSVFVSIDNLTGKITNYNFNWFKNASFPAVNGIISPAQALANMADFADYSVRYISNGMTDDGKINVSLVYRFEQTVTIDALNGKAINGWNFDDLEKQESYLPEYADLDGHWSKEVVTTLAENGIWVWGGSTFDPDAAITRDEFYSYLWFYIGNSWAFTRQESSIFVNTDVWRTMDKARLVERRIEPNHHQTAGG